MKRFGFVAFAALVAISGVCAPASAEINYHNGWIHVEVRGDAGNVKLEVLNALGGVVERRLIRTGDVFDLNACCFAAGFMYVFRTIDTNAQPTENPKANNPVSAFSLSEHVSSIVFGKVVPRLCSKNLIPYGYAAVILYVNRKGSAPPTGQLNRLDTQCPT